MSSQPDLGVIDLLGSDFVSDPYPIYRRLREHRPLAPVSVGGHILTRYGDVKQALSNSKLGNAPSRFSALRPAKRDVYPAADLASNILPFIDAPQHQITRKAVATMFHAAALRVESDLPDLAAKYADLARQSRNCDIARDLAEPFAIECMCRMFGFSYEDTSKLKIFSERFFYLFAPITDIDLFSEINRSIADFREYVRGQLRSQKNTGTSVFLDEHLDADGLSVDAIADNIILLFADGVENIKYSVAHILYILQSELGDLSDLNNDATIRRSVSEALRLESPAQIIPRIVSEEFELHGVCVKPNTAIFLALGSANRDEQLFPEPDQFQLGREQGKALSFGVGQHSCVGRSFASKQISQLIGALAAVPDVRVTTETLQVEFIARFGHRWPNNIRLTC